MDETNQVPDEAQQVSDVFQGETNQGISENLGVPSESDAADALARLMGGESASPPVSPQATPPAQPSATQAAQQQATPPAEQKADAPAEQAADMPELNRESVISIPGEDGKVQEVKLDDLLGAYQKMSSAEEQVGVAPTDLPADLSQKLQANYQARLQEQGVQQMAQAYQEQNQQIQKLAGEVAQLEAETAQAPQYNAEDPETSNYWQSQYLIKMNQLTGKRTQLAQLTNQQQQTESTLSSGQKEAMYSSMDGLWPELANPMTRQAEMAKVNQHLGSYGFTAQEVGSVGDPRFFMLIKDAMNYRAMRDAAKLNVAKTGTSPNRFKVSGPQGGGQKPGLTRQQNARLAGQVLGQGNIRALEGMGGHELDDIGELI